MKPHRAMKRAAAKRGLWTRSHILAVFKNEIEDREFQDAETIARGGLPELADEIADLRARWDRFKALPVDPQKQFYSDAEFTEIIGFL